MFDYITLTIQYQFIFMLNCGGSIDIVSRYHINESQTVIIIDSHRPFHLKNVWSPRVVLFDYSNNVIDCVHDESDLNIDPTLLDDDEDEDVRNAQFRIREYYRNSYYDTPSSIVMFDISKRLNKKNNNHLWAAAIGLTEQLLFEKIDMKDYLDYYVELKKEVLSLNSVKESKMHVDDGMEIKVGNDERILLCQDYKFPLYRHWNIYDSMSNSSFVSSRLSIWNERGKTRMKSFLAQMGVPLEECQQNFTSMKSKFKEVLPKKFKKYASAYKLDGLFFESFYRNYGITYTATASDMVYALTALLEREQTLNLEHFWRAASALGNLREAPNTIKEGVLEAIKLQINIAQQVIAIIERKSIINSAEFRIVTIVGAGDEALFYTPSGISKLGTYLMEMCRQRYNKAKALIVCCENKETKTTLILGLSAKPRNDFGIAFRKASRSLKINFNHSGLDDHIIEMKSDFVKQFIDTVHYVFKSESSDDMNYE